MLRLRSLVTLASACVFFLLIAACGGGGGGGTSTTPIESPVIERPVLSVALADQTQVTVEWQYDDAPAAVSSYDLFVDTAAVTTGSTPLLTNIATNRVSFDHTQNNALAPVVSDTTYQYLLRANLADGSSQLSNALTVRTIAATVAAPIISAITAGTETLTVSWNSVADAAGYKVFYQQGLVLDSNQRSSALLTSTATNFVVGDGGTLTAGVTYTVSVASVSLNGVNAVETDPFEELSAAETLVPLYPAFSPPTLSLQAGDGTPSIFINIDDSNSVYSQNNTPAQSFIIYYSSSSSVTRNASSLTTTNATLLLTDTEVAPSTTYYVRASAINPDGVEGELSVEASATTGEVPLAAPTNLTVVTALVDGTDVDGNRCTACSSAFVISWDAVPEANGYQAILFDSLTNNTTTVAGNTTSATVSALSQGSAHTIGARAVSATGAAGLSVAATGFISLYNLAPPPDSVTVTPTTGALIVRWTTRTYPVNSVITTPATYVVHQMSSGRSDAITLASTSVTDGSNSYRFASTNTATSFYFAVSTVNLDGVDGNTSTQVPVGTPLPTDLGSVQNLIATSGNDAIALAWDATTGYGENDSRLEYIVYWDHATNQFPTTLDTSTAASFTVSGTSHTFTRGETVGGYRFAVLARHEEHNDILGSTTTETTAVLLVSPLAASSVAHQSNPLTKAVTSTVNFSGVHTRYPATQQIALALLHTETATLPATARLDLLTRDATLFLLPSGSATSVTFAASSSSPPYEFTYDATHVSGGSTIPIALCHGLVIAGNIYCSYTATSEFIEPIPPSVPTDVTLHFAPSGASHGASISWAWANNNNNQADNFRIYSYNAGDDITPARSMASTVAASADYSMRLDGLFGYDDASLAKSNFTYAVEACVGADVCSQPATATIISGGNPANRGLQYIKSQTAISTIQFGEQVAISASGTRIVVLKRVGGSYHIETLDRNGAAEEFGNAHATDLNTNITTASSIEMKLTVDGNYIFVSDPANKQVRIYQWNNTQWVEVTNLSPVTNNATGFADRIAVSDAGNQLAVYINSTTQNSAEHVLLYNIDLNNGSATQIGTATLEATVTIGLRNDSGFNVGTTTEARSIDDVAMAFNEEGDRLAISPKNKLHDISLYDYQFNNGNWSLAQMLRTTAPASSQYAVVGIARFTLQDDFMQDQTDGRRVSGVRHAHVRVIHSALVGSFGIMLSDDISSESLNSSIPNTLAEGAAISRLATIQQVGFSVDASNMYVIAAGTGADNTSGVNRQHGAYGAYATNAATRNNHIEIFAVPYNLGSASFLSGYYAIPMLFKHFNFTDNQEDVDGLGASISTSASMNAIIFGAPLEDSDTTGITDIRQFPQGTATNPSTPNNNATDRGMILVY